jgi:hypothetical protein
VTFSFSSSGVGGHGHQAHAGAACLRTLRLGDRGSASSAGARRAEGVPAPARPESSATPGLPRPCPCGNLVAGCAASCGAWQHGDRGTAPVPRDPLRPSEGAGGLRHRGRVPQASQRWGRSPGDPSDAREAQLEATVARHPEDIEIRLELAKAYLVKQNLKAAWRHTQEILRRSPGDARALTYEGLYAPPLASRKSHSARSNRRCDESEPAEAHLQLARLRKTGTRAGCRGRDRGRLAPLPGQGPDAEPAARQDARAGCAGKTLLPPWRASCWMSCGSS